MAWIALVAFSLCTGLALALFFRERKLRSRAGDVPVRRRRAGSSRWGRGRGLWVHDVFCYRGRLGVRHERLTHVTKASARGLVGDAETRRLRWLGDGVSIAVLTGSDGTVTEFAARAEHAVDLLGPFAVEVVGTPKKTRT